MMMRLPYSLTIEHKREVLRLEQDVRALLQCQGRQCAFLQSAEYAALKFDALRTLLGTHKAEAAHVARLHVPGSTLILCTSMDPERRRVDVVIQSQPMPFAAAPRAAAAATTAEPPTEKAAEEELEELEEEEEQVGGGRRKVTMRLVQELMRPPTRRGKRRRAAAGGCDADD